MTKIKKTGVRIKKLKEKTVSWGIETCNSKPVTGNRNEHPLAC